MYIKIFFNTIDQDHLSRYKDLYLIKADMKGLIKNYLQKIISSISHLQDEPLEVVESNIQRNSRGTY